jgi:D-glycero-alpha-D-manno-heptose 1-phosphate guanylyltransferase
MINEAIILAGGLGSRLRDSLPDLPKPMAPIGGKPFLYYVMDYLYQAGIKRAILSVGHMHEDVSGYFGKQFKGIQLEYAIESSPLGTGGAIKLALEQTRSNEVAILNGDTFFPVPLREMYDFHRYQKADLTLALKPMHKFDRYGTVELVRDRVKTFKEKTYMEYGLINGGLYIMRKNILAGNKWPEKFSFEKDLLEKKASRLIFAGFSCDQYFVDIGIPEDYARAEKELPHWMLYGHS